MTPQFLAAILTLCMGWPPHWTDRKETHQHRHDRFGELAKAHAALELPPDVEPEDAVAVSLAIVWHETHGSAYVQENRCKEGPPGMRCDEGLARSPWQLHEATCPKLWEEGATLADGAQCAARYFWYGYDQCSRPDDPDKLARAFAYYHRGHCSEPEAKHRARVRTFRAFSEILQSGWPKAPDGWDRLTAPNKDRELARWARGLLSAPVGWHAQSGEYGALVEWHFGEKKGWHKGVSLFRVTP